MNKLPEPRIWMGEVARVMVCEGITFREAVADLRLPLTPSECDAVRRRAEFEDTLRDAKLKHQSSIGDNPNLNKSAAIGIMQLAIEKLLEEGEYMDAIVGVEKLAKVAGWIGAESTVNVFAGMTARDIEEARIRVKRELQPSGNA